MAQNKEITNIAHRECFTKINSAKKNNIKRTIENSSVFQMMTVCKTMTKTHKLKI